MAYPTDLKLCTMLQSSSMPLAYVHIDGTGGSNHFRVDLQGQRV
jgi:hypothetical protein